MSLRQYKRGSNFSWVAVPHNRTLLVWREKDWSQGRAVTLKVCLILWDLRPHGWETSWLFRWLLLFWHCGHCSLTQTWVTYPFQTLRIPAVSYDSTHAWRVDYLDLKTKPEHVWIQWSQQNVVEEVKSGDTRAWSNPTAWPGWQATCSCCGLALEPAAATGCGTTRVYL